MNDEQSDPSFRPCEQCGTSAPYDAIFAKFWPAFQCLCDQCTDGKNRAEEARRLDLEKQRRLAAYEKEVPLRYRETDTSHPDFPRPIWNAMKNLPLDQRVGVIGPAGLGKTRLLALLAKRVSLAGHSLGWITSTTFQWAAQREFDDREGGEARAILRRLKSVDFLVLDDLGKQRWTDTVEAAFYDLLESRSGSYRVTHWSANPKPGESLSSESISRDETGILSRALDSTGTASKRARWMPIVSRLIEDTLIVPVI